MAYIRGFTVVIINQDIRLDTALQWLRQNMNQVQTHEGLVISHPQQWAMGCLLGSIAQRIMNGAPLSSGITPVTLWVLCCPKQVSQTGISNCIPQYSVGCNYLSLPEIPASGTKVLIYLWDAITYPCWRYLLLVPKSSYSKISFIPLCFRCIWYRLLV